MSLAWGGFLPKGGRYTWKLILAKCEKDLPIIKIQTVERGCCRHQAWSGPEGSGGLGNVSYGAAFPTERENEQRQWNRNHFTVLRKLRISVWLELEDDKGSNSVEAKAGDNFLKAGKSYGSFHSSFLPFPPFSPYLPSFLSSFLLLYTLSPRFKLQPSGKPYVSAEYRPMSSCYTTSICSIRLL